MARACAIGGDVVFILPRHGIDGNLSGEMKLMLALSYLSGEERGESRPLAARATWQPSL